MNSNNILHFFEYLLWDTLSVANEVQELSDRDIRERMSALQVREAQELDRAAAFIKDNNLSRTKLKKKNRKDPLRAKYDSMIKKANKCNKERTRLEEVLHARLVLKDPQGIVVWLAHTGFFEKYNFDICGDKAIDALRRRYPD